MGSCCGNDAPQPPNPTATAAAQTGTNVSTAIANSYLGNINQTTPSGNLSFEKFADFTYTDPTTGQTFNIPRWNAKQTLSDTGQKAFDQGQQAQLNLSQMANQQSGSLKNFLSTPFNANFNPQAYLAANPDVANAAAKLGEDPSTFAVRHWREFGINEGRQGGQLPGMGSTSGMEGTAQAIGDAGPSSGYQFGYGSGGNIQDAYGMGGDITRSYGPQDNFSADRQRVEDALMQRLNPQLELENDRVRQRLADQGIRAGQGFDAYDAGMDVYNRQANDARFAAIQQAGQEQQRMNEMARNQAMFQNSAQAQANQQNAALAAFANQAQAQREGQGAARSAFYNAASGSQFGEQQARAALYNQAAAQNLGRASTIFNSQNQLRNQALQEMYQQRSQPINEITSLLSGGQVSQPNFINAARTQIPTTDVAGIINQNFAQQNDIFKTQQQFWGDIIGGTLGAAGNVGKGWMMSSDRRVKEEIEPMGSVFGNGKKLPIYEYQFKDDPSGTRHTGPMAQDVERLDPRAVTEIGGVKHIKLDRMGSIFGRGS